MFSVATLTSSQTLPFRHNLNWKEDREVSDYIGAVGCKFILQSPPPPVDYVICSPWQLSARYTDILPTNTKTTDFCFMFHTVFHVSLVPLRRFSPQCLTWRTAVFQFATIFRNVPSRIVRVSCAADGKKTSHWNTATVTVNAYFQLHAQRTRYSEWYSSKIRDSKSCWLLLDTVTTIELKCAL